MLVIGSCTAQPQAQEQARASNRCKRHEFHITTLSKTPELYLYICLPWTSAAGAPDAEAGVVRLFRQSLRPRTSKWNVSQSRCYVNSRPESWMVASPLQVLK